MNLWLRMLWVVLTGFFRPRMHPMDESVLHFRVWPDDLDVNFHVNNGRYLTYMDLGRLDLILRSGMWRTMVGKRWNPVVGSAQVRFRRALKLGEPFTLRTRALAWDKRWVFLEHRLESRGRTACLALVKAAFVGPDGLVSSQELTEALQVDHAPELPPAVRAWQNAEPHLAESET